jgi:hypothetical protein
MTHEEVVFFNVSRVYAEPKHDYRLMELNIDAKVKLYRLTFQRPGAPPHITREVTVFEDQFQESVVRRELLESIRRNIDEALGN